MDGRILSLYSSRKRKMRVKQKNEVIRSGCDTIKTWPASHTSEAEVENEEGRPWFGDSFPMCVETCSNGMHTHTNRHTHTLMKHIEVSFFRQFKFFGSSAVPFFFLFLYKEVFSFCCSCSGLWCNVFFSVSNRREMKKREKKTWMCLDSSHSIDPELERRRGIGNRVLGSTLCFE